MHSWAKTLFFVAWRAFTPLIAGLFGLLSPFNVASGSAADADAIAAQRLTCMFGEQSDKVAKGRLAGQKSIPDAADTCLEALTRTAHGGHLPDLYRVLLAQLGGDVLLADGLPLAIGNAALDGKDEIPIGNGKQLDVLPTLALDAGFTVAYLKGDNRDPGLDGVQLKAVAEACLAVKKVAVTCFQAGYFYGQQAVRAR